LDLSIVIISRNEAPRLRLALASLAAQDAIGVMCETIVVDDGSEDGTADVLAEAREKLRPRVIVHARNAGRSAARNAGAAAARGARLLFLDGDVLAAPNLALAHAAIAGRRMGRGETFHLRCTRFFFDPEACTPLAGQEERVKRMGADLTPFRVTRAQIEVSFGEIESRGEPGIYPGAGPRRVYELEMRALRASPQPSVAWMAASGHNFSVPRREFLDEGGFDERLSMNEHRELAFRLNERGLRMLAVPARSYHMTHRPGWRDPVLDGSDWERPFFERHPTLSVKLMSIFWRSLADDVHIPAEARICSLEQLDDVVNGKKGPDYDVIRRRHPFLQDLSTTRREGAS
jgi:glycosyltransferase involved in cell wall biosynthesis